MKRMYIHKTSIRRIGDKGSHEVVFTFIDHNKKKTEIYTNINAVDLFKMAAHLVNRKYETLVRLLSTTKPGE